ncbi:MAG TPA: ankyrin repeat domain-containing protein, partial [Magnetospirillaceae bacterium]|nr:ankyrin repeat domain-containing protein [Magnetospirillaceae bacterium]
MGNSVFRTCSILVIMTALAACASPPPPIEAPLVQEPVDPDVVALAGTGDLDSVRNLGRGRELINRPGANGDFPLHAAAGRASPDMAALLLDQGAQIDPRDARGRTPLRRALESGALPTARLLASRGASLFAADSAGVTPLDDALVKGAEPLAAVVLASNVNAAGPDGRTALHAASDRLLLPAVTYLLTLSPDLSLRDKAGRTALDCALLHPSRRESAQIARFLVLRGAEPGFGDFEWFILAARSADWARPRFSEGDTVLHRAVRNNLRGFTEYFLDENVPVDLKNAAGATSLHEAVRSGRYDIAELLLS